MKFYDVPINRRGSGSPRPAWLIVFLVASMCLTPLKVMSVDRYDQSSPIATFRSLGKAIENNDPKAMWEMIGWLVPVPYDWFLKEVWQTKTGEVQKYLLHSEKLGGAASARVAQFFRDAEVLKASVVPHTEPHGISEQMLLIRWGEGKIIRKEHFVLFPKGTAWKWFPDPYGQDEEAYDFTTPANAYLLVAQIFAYQLVGEVVKTYATSVKGGLSNKEWERILRERLSRKTDAEKEELWQTPYMERYSPLIEEAMEPPPAGLPPTKCKVWRLRDGDRKRRDFELFILEGKEWKWLPKPEYFWYPSKVEPK